MRYIYYTDSAKRCGAKRSYVGYIGYIFYKILSGYINYYFHNLYNIMRYIYDTDSAKRSYVGLYGVHILYTDYIKIIFFGTLSKHRFHVNYYVHNLQNNMGYIYNTDSTTA